MKKFTLLLFMVLLLGTKVLKAAETEPNNTKAQANTLALNGSNTGAITANDEDWWKITTTADGNLNVTIAVSNGITMRCYIYDNNGTTQLSSGYSSSTTTISADGLAAGTYYVRLIAYYAGQLPAYAVSNTFVVPAQANDTEPNNNAAQAKVLALNKSTTGHAGYYYNLKRDTADWFKITTNANGRLRLTLQPGNGKTMRIYLYDNNGTTLLGSEYSSTNAVLNADGLAAGTYYVSVFCYYNSDFAPYTLYDSLFLPAQANDTEPNNTRAQAQNLPLNNSTTGHCGYYYNLYRDTADWFKITTNANGRLRLTLKPANGKTMRIYLYDNNGTTLLGSEYSSTNAVLNVDGLAPGTYYAKVFCYYSSDFAPYNLYDSLFLPAQANDTEPNNTKAQAKNLPQNSSTTGHVGYYYNLKRDTADWFKITTNTDGLLRLTLKPANGNTMRIYLYDNDGTTLLGSEYSSSNAILNRDGLAAGTYYVKVFCYYNYNFAPYTLTDSLITYNNNADQEQNKYASQARAIPANGTIPGHVGFYYNKTRDTTDWHKINYTGLGDLSFTINQETLLSGGTNTLRFAVYKDTSASPIHSSYSSAASRVVNLTSLTQGYYWIKIYAYYNSDFSSYSLSNTFTQVSVATVKATAYDTAGSCATVNSITFKPAKNNPPYTIQLYRFDMAYGIPIVTKKAYTFTNLPPGVYYATAYADGATGTAFGKSKNISIEPVPSGLNTINITSKQARLRWTTVNCADYYTVRYRASNATQWTTKKTTGNENNLLIKNLTPNTKYYWKVATSDSANGITATGAYADSISFTTAASLIAANEEEPDAVSINNEITASVLKTFPNPATSYFVINFRQGNQSGEKVMAQLFDANGKSVWSSGLINAGTLNGRQVNVDRLGKGVFYLKILNGDGSIAGSAKVMIVK